LQLLVQQFHVKAGTQKQSLDEEQKRMQTQLLHALVA
jgi:hypothetical protein